MREHVPARDARKRDDRQGDSRLGTSPDARRPHPREDDRRDNAEHRQRADPRVRKAGDQPRARRQVRSKPSVERGDQRRDVGQNGIDDGGEQSEPEQRRDHGRRKRVAEHGVGRHRPELHEQDRRRHDATGCRDGHHARDDAGQWIALEQPHERRHENEDRRDGRERELEARVEEVVRAPDEQHQGADEEKPPAIALTGTDPREGGQGAGDTGADDGRLCADGHHIGADRGERADFADETRDPEEPGEQQHASGHERDVRPRDRQQVVEAGCPEIIPQGVGQPFVLSEDDAEQDRAPFSGRPGRDGGVDRAAYTVCEPGQPASVTDDTPVSTAHDHVDAVATKPRPFIEAVVRSARRDERRSQLEHGALRRRPPEWKLEQDRLSDPLGAEPLDAGGYA